MPTYPTGPLRKAGLPGDKTVLENASQTGYYVVYLVEPEYRYEEKTVNVRHILIKAEEGAAQDVKDEAKAKAEDILEQWKAGAATEESFAGVGKGIQRGWKCGGGRPL